MPVSDHGRVHDEFFLGIPDDKVSVVSGSDGSLPAEEPGETGGSLA
jgi:hypothetical protein